jgi:hypothetical protein
MPEFLVADGFSGLHTNAFALIVDRFLGRGAWDFRGPWLGTGIAYWKSDVEREGFGEPYTPKRLNAEVSLKIGYHF